MESDERLPTGPHFAPAGQSLRVRARVPPEPSPTRPRRAPAGRSRRPGQAWASFFWYLASCAKKETMRQFVPLKFAEARGADVRCTIRKEGVIDDVYTIKDFL